MAADGKVLITYFKSLETIWECFNNTKTTLKNTLNAVSI